MARYERGSRNGQSLIVPIRVLRHWRQLELLVPRVVIDEFERNRPNAEARVAQKVSPIGSASYGETCMSTPIQNGSTTGSTK